VSVLVGGREGPPSFEARTWLALMVLGLLLFAGGVYVALGVEGVLPSAARGLPAGVYLPFALTIPGGALAMYSYEAWYQHPDGPGGRERRRRSLHALPSFEIHAPPAPKEPPSRRRG
jgi:hypothetical protein